MTFTQAIASKLASEREALGAGDAALNVVAVAMIVGLDLVLGIAIAQITLRLWRWLNQKTAKLTDAQSHQRPTAVD